MLLPFPYTPHRLPDRLDLPLRDSPFFASSLRAVPDSSAVLCAFISYLPTYSLLV
jgi:hypothetical protein